VEGIDVIMSAKTTVQIRLHPAGCVACTRSAMMISPLGRQYDSPADLSAIHLIVGRSSIGKGNYPVNGRRRECALLEERHEAFQECGRSGRVAGTSVDSKQLALVMIKVACRPRPIRFTSRKATTKYAKNS
jgi:hypothetical protein